MKKFFAMFMLLLLPFLVFGQDVPEPPGDFVGMWDWFKAALVTWPGALAAILLLTEKIKRLLNLKGTWAVFLSWGLAAPLSFIGYYFDIGIFAGVQWYVAAIYALSFTISANLTYLIPIVKEATRIIIDWISASKEAKINKSK